MDGILVSFFWKGKNSANYTSSTFFFLSEKIKKISRSQLKSIGTCSRLTLNEKLVIRKGN